MSGLKLKLHEFHGKLAFAAKLNLYLQVRSCWGEWSQIYCFSGIPWWSSDWDSVLSLWRAWVQSLFRELGSHKPQSVAKRKKKSIATQCSKGVAVHIEKCGRRALDSAGQNRIKEKQYFVFLSECVYSQREAKR